MGILVSSVTLRWWGTPRVIRGDRARLIPGSLIRSVFHRVRVVIPCSHHRPVPSDVAFEEAGKSTLEQNSSRRKPDSLRYRQLRCCSSLVLVDVNYGSDYNVVLLQPPWFCCLGLGKCDAGQENVQRKRGTVVVRADG